ncbi:hypothetical protein ACIQZI_19585 [Peribacillus sp. NPDC096379]
MYTMENSAYVPLIDCDTQVKRVQEIITQYSTLFSMQKELFFVII